MRLMNKKYLLATAMSLSVLFVGVKGFCWGDERSETEKAYFEEGYAANDAFIRTTQKRPLLKISYSQYPQGDVLVTPDHPENLQNVTPNEKKCVLAQLKEIAKVGLLRDFATGKPSESISIRLRSESVTNAGHGYFNVGPFNIGGAWVIVVGLAKSGSKCQIVTSAQFTEKASDYFGQLQDTKVVSEMMRLRQLEGNPVTPTSVESLIDNSNAGLQELITVIEGSGN